MAEQSQIAGLFMTPEQYQQTQDNAAYERAAALAQMDPFQAAKTSIGYGAYKLGGAIGGALGGEDPMLKQLSAVQNIMKQVNPNDPRSLMAAAQQLAPVAPQQAAQLAQQARDAQEKIAKTSSETVTAKLAIAGKHTPESIAKFQSTGNLADLEAIDTSTKPSDDWLAAARSIGLKAGKTFNDYTPEEVAKVNLMVLNNKQAVAQAGRATTVFQQETEFAKTLGAEQAKKLTAAIDQGVVSNDALTRITQMKKLNDSGTLYQGPTANATVTTANFLNSIGLISKDEAKRLSNSEVYSKLAKDLVMKDLGNKLGNQISDADRDYVEARIPQLSTSPLARTELLNKLQEIHAKNINYARRMQSYAEKNNSLKGFDFIPEQPKENPSAPAATPVPGGASLRWNPKTKQLEPI